MEILHYKSNEFRTYSPDLYMGYDDEHSTFSVYCANEQILKKLRYFSLGDRQYTWEGVIEREKFGKWFGYPHDPADLFGTDVDLEGFHHIEWECSAYVMEKYFRVVYEWITYTIPLNELRSLINDPKDACKGAAIVAYLVGHVGDEDSMAYWNAWASRLRNPEKYVEAFVHDGAGEDPRLSFLKYASAARPDDWNPIALDYLVPRAILMIECKLEYLDLSDADKTHTKKVLSLVRSGSYTGDRLGLLIQEMARMSSASTRLSFNLDHDSFQYVWKTAYYLTLWKLS